MSSESRKAAYETSKYSNINSESESEPEHEIKLESTKSNQFKYNDYMKNYMREYRKKQKLQQEENKHCCCICNKLCKDIEVEALIKKMLSTLIHLVIE